MRSAKYTVFRARWELMTRDTSDPASKQNENIPKF